MCLIHSSLYFRFSSLELAALLQDDYQDERDFLDSILMNSQQPSYDHILQDIQSLPPGWNINVSTDFKLQVYSFVFIFRSYNGGTS